MNKKQLSVIIVLLTIIAILLFIVGVLTLGVFIVLPNVRKENVAVVEVDPNEPWSADMLKKGRVTVIDTETRYTGDVNTIEQAEAELRAFGEREREKYNNPKVEKIEKRIEKKYGIYAVNLGEMDVETAKDVEKAVKYIYERYPIIKGTLTNISLSNIDTFKTGIIAETRYKTYIENVNESSNIYNVVKFEIILSASSFLNREQLIEKCEAGVETNYWPEGMDISTLIVHELSHQVLDAYIMEYYGFDHNYFITEDNEEAYIDYINDGLAANQTVSKMVVETAYNNWLKTNPGKDMTDFCKSISGYAQGLQEDGGISYPETVAEALADIYLNGDNASSASHAIEDVIMNKN